MRAWRQVQGKKGETEEEGMWKEDQSTKKKGKINKIDTKGMDKIRRRRSLMRVTDRKRGERRERQQETEKRNIWVAKTYKKRQRNNKRELEKRKFLVGERKERERCEGGEETSREKRRRWTKEEVITAQQEPDERALMAEADWAPLPNEQVRLMRNAKWNRSSEQTAIVQITLWLDLFAPLKYLVEQILNKSSTKRVVRQSVRQDTRDYSQKQSLRAFFNLPSLWLKQVREGVWGG